MYKVSIISLLLWLMTLPHLIAQADCNHLGVWLWHLEPTGFFTHEHLAFNLAALGVSRVYVKVADGRMDSIRWPELTDKSLISAYQEEGIEVWAWSYNYPENDSLQAESLYQAARTGYYGYVVDVESEFNGQPLATHNLFFAFSQARRRAMNDGIAIDTFNLYCTTWGNPKTHDFPISIIDPWVTGYMPQTYVELWSFADLDDIPLWIAKGNQEYAELGATQPIHHLCATQEGLMTSDQINAFIAASGAETSLWRVPGGGVPLTVWNDWMDVDWEQNFCEELTDIEIITTTTFSIYPNPTTGMINWSTAANVTSFLIYDMSGRLVLQSQVPSHSSLDISHLPQGIYLLEARYENQSEFSKVIKN